MMSMTMIMMMVTLMTMMMITMMVIMVMMIKRDGAENGDVNDHEQIPNI